MNLGAYTIYLLLTGYLTFSVGHQLFRHGAKYLHELFPDKAGFCGMINRILLLGYYLINLGYPAIGIRFWPKITSKQMALEVLVEKFGIILITLGLLHMFNLAILYFLSVRMKYNSTLNHNH